MPNVLPMRRNLEIFHVGFQHIDLNSREPEHRSVVVDELPDKRSGASQTLRFLLDAGRLFGREAEGLGEVVVSRGRFRHWIGSPFSCRTVLASTIQAWADRYRLTGDESFIEAQAAGLALLFPLQGEVRREWGQHSVADGTNALVIEEVTLAAPGEALDGVRMQLVRLDELRRDVSSRQRREERSTLHANRFLDHLVRA